MTYKCPHCGNLIGVDIEVTQATQLEIEQAKAELIDRIRDPKQLSDLIRR